MKSMQTPVVRADKLKICQFAELRKHRYCQEQHISELRIAFPSVDGWSNKEFPSQKDQKSQNLGLILGVKTYHLHE